MIGSINSLQRNQSTDEGDKVSFTINKENKVKIYWNRNKFTRDVSIFVKDYVFNNPLTAEEKLIKYISKNNFDSYDEHRNLLSLTWNIDVIDDSVIFKIPLAEFNVDLEKCDEKEQLEYYKEKCHHFEKLIKINNLMVEQIEITEFDENCIFKIYSFDDYVKFQQNLPASSEWSQSYESYKSNVVSKIFSSLAEYYQCIRTPSQYQIELMKEIKHGQLYNSLFCIEYKKFSVQMNVYENKMEIKNLRLLLNDNFANPVDFDTFFGYFNHDIMLKSNVKYSKGVYKSNIIRVDFSVSASKRSRINNTTSSSSKLSNLTVFYRLIYCSRKIFLKCLEFGYQKKEWIDKENSRTRQMCYSPKDKFVVQQQQYNSNNRQIKVDEIQYLPSVGIKLIKKTINYSKSASFQKQQYHYSYSIGCDLIFDPLILYKETQT